MNYSDLKIGMNAVVTKTITETDIILFAGISMDNNPAHTNEEYAKNTMFKHRIAHGMLSVGLISAALGTKLPGEGSIYLSQDVKFVAPVYVGDTISANVEIIQLIPEKNRVILKTDCVNQNGTLVITGKATLMKK